MIDPILGQFVKAPEDLGDVTQRALDASCEAFLRAGGHFTWNDWERYSPATRAALVVAGDRVAIDRLRRAFTPQVPEGDALQAVADEVAGVQ